MTRLFSIAFAVLLCCAAVVCAQSPQGRERLVLKDGSYQVVTGYSVKEGTVRFRSAERGDWEELPAELVDWNATARYNHEHDPGMKPAPGDPGAQEAAELDREAAAQKSDAAARRPEVAPGLRLPDEDGVFGLDNFNGTPELVRVRQSDGDLNLDTGHTLKAVEIPKGGARDLIRLPGYRAAISFHVARPVFYIALDTPNNVPPAEDALVVNTHGLASSVASLNDAKKQRASPPSTYALVRLRVWKNQRAASAEELSLLGKGGSSNGSDEVVATRKKVLAGRHWMQVTPVDDLNLGQYSLVEILPGGGFNVDGWDFGLNPMAPENKNAFSPIGADAP